MIENMRRSANIVFEDEDLSIHESADSISVRVDECEDSFEVTVTAFDADGDVVRSSQMQLSLAPYEYCKFVKTLGSVAGMEVKEDD